MAESELPPFSQATAGAFGSIVSNSLVYPLDLLSTRLQTQSKGKSSKSDNASILGALQDIVRKQGVGGLYQGLGADTLSNTLSNFLYFYFYSYLREALTTRKERRLPKPSKDSKGAPAVQFTVVEELAVGALAGIASRFFTTPLSNVTVRKQTSATSSGKKAEKGGKDEKQPPADSESDSDADDSYSDEPGTIEIMRQIVQDKGVWGLWSGFETAVLLSSSPALTFFFTNAFARALIPSSRRDSPSALQTFVTSAAANSVATIALFPLILSKTRLQWRSPSGRRMYRSLADVIRKTIRRQGIVGLYQGLSSQLVKGLVGHGTTMAVKSRVESLFIWLYFFLLRNRRNGLKAGAA